jgi:fructoselysine-6-P-deglycase FrlB-like protein
MPRADLTIALHTDRLTPYLRADQIRTDTLTMLATAMAEDPEARRELIDHLDTLGAVLTGRAREGEVDDVIADIEAVADMGRAQVQLTRDELSQLAREAAYACNTLTPATVPAQVRGEAA